MSLVCSYRHHHCLCIPCSSQLIIGQKRTLSVLIRTAWESIWHIFILLQIQQLMTIETPQTILNPWYSESKQHGSCWLSITYIGLPCNRELTQTPYKCQVPFATVSYLHLNNFISKEIHEKFGCRKNKSLLFTCQIVQCLCWSPVGWYCFAALYGSSFILTWFDKNILREDMCSVSVGWDNMSATCQQLRAFMVNENY